MLDQLHSRMNTLYQVQIFHIRLLRATSGSQPLENGELVEDVHGRSVPKHTVIGIHVRASTGICIYYTIYVRTYNRPQGVTEMWHDIPTCTIQPVDYSQYCQSVCAVLVLVSAVLVLSGLLILSSSVSTVWQYQCCHRVEIFGLERLIKKKTEKITISLDFADSQQTKICLDLRKYPRKY